MEGVRYGPIYGVTPVYIFIEEFWNNTYSCNKYIYVNWENVKTYLFDRIFFDAFHYPVANSQMQECEIKPKKIIKVNYIYTIFTICSQRPHVSF